VNEHFNVAEFIEELMEEERARVKKEERKVVTILKKRRITRSWKTMNHTIKLDQKYPMNHLGFDIWFSSNGENLTTSEIGFFRLELTF
jgi:hypothetical protein